MIPSSKKPKYKILRKLRKDIWGNITTKSLHKKKWRLLRLSLCGQKKRLQKANLRHYRYTYYINKAKAIRYRFLTNIEKRLLTKIKKCYNKKLFKNTLINYNIKPCSRFPDNFRYKYQRKLYIRQTMRLIYGSLQEYKLKYIARSSKTYTNFIHNMEQQPAMFLYRVALIPTLSSVRMLAKKKVIIVNGCYNKATVKKGDILHFALSFENYLKHKFFGHKKSLILWNKKIKSLKKKKKLNTKKLFYVRQIKRFSKYYKTSNDVNFDVTQFRFHFLENLNLNYLKNHPFFIPYQRLWRHYHRV